MTVTPHSGFDVGGTLFARGWPLSDCIDGSKDVTHCVDRWIRSKRWIVRPIAPISLRCTRKYYSGVSKLVKKVFIQL